MIPAIGVCLTAVMSALAGAMWIWGGLVWKQSGNAEDPLVARTTASVFTFIALVVFIGALVIGMVMVV